MQSSNAGDHRIEPEFLGPLGDRPLAEMAGKSSPGDLFPGASKYLSQRQQTKRRAQWNAVRPMVKRMLQPGEHVLHVAYAQGIPPFMDHVGFGHFVYAYHQVVLVITDQRIIEALLNFRGNAPGTRLRSFPYRSMKALTLRFGKLTAVPGQGRKQGWRFRLGGDKKLVALLLPRLQQRLFAEGAGHSEASPQWHCPRCGAGVPPKPEECTSCRTHFRSTRMATILSLAFPGAGLFYLGHPFLALSDFLGEMTLFAVWVAMMMGASEGDGMLPAVVMGGFFFTITKLQSIQMGRVLGCRSIPEPEGRRDRVTKLALAGASLSALLVAGAFPLAAVARPRLEHDIDLATEDGSWSGSRRAADWATFKDDTSARSQWTHTPTGAHVTVFAYPQSLLEDPETFHRDYAARMQKNAVRTIADDAQVPAPFHGFRYITELKGKNGQEVALVSYFLYDQEARDIHHLSLAVPLDDAQAADAVIQDFVHHAKFVDAIPPQR